MSNGGLLEITEKVLSQIHNDPAGCNIDLPFRATFYPLGFAVEFATNSCEVMAGAEESWGHFRKAFSVPAVRIDIAVTPGESENCPPAPVCRWRHNLLTSVAGPDNFVVCDLRQGFAYGWLTQAVADNPAYLRYHFLEGTALILIQGLYTTPLHASCVEMKGTGILLCGESGAGKSSLAFGCARRGWKFLSDDCCSIVRKDQNRTVVGNPHQMRFRESAIELFQELRNRQITVRATGKIGIELKTAALPTIATIDRCTIDFIVFLNRHDCAVPGISPVSKDVALEYFEQHLCIGEEDTRRTQRESVHNLLTAEILEMRYSDLHWAVSCLETLVTERLS